MDINWHSLPGSSLAVCVKHLLKCASHLTLQLHFLEFILREKYKFAKLYVHNC